MKKFKYPLRIYGTPDKLREIRDELLTLGYYEKGANIIREGIKFTLTQFLGNGRMDHFSSGGDGIKVSANDRDLVLALAAMVHSEDGYKGEAYVCIGNHYNFTDKKIYFLQVDGLTSSFAFIDDTGAKNGFSEGNLTKFRKATKEEIINHFEKIRMEEEFDKRSFATVTVSVPPPPKYSVSEDFIKEAHAAACSTWKKKIEAEFPVLFAKTYEIGQTFKDERGERHILAQTGEYLVSLISLSNGNRFRDGVYVKDLNKVSQEEFALISGGNFTEE